MEVKRCGEKCSTSETHLLKATASQQGWKWGFPLELQRNFKGIQAVGCNSHPRVTQLCVGLVFKPAWASAERGSHKLEFH